MAGGRQQRSVAASTRRSPASYGRQMAFDLDYFLALPRAAGLALSPDGNRLVTSVGTLNPDRTKYVTALWELDPSGVRPPRRPTRSDAGAGVELRSGRAPTARSRTWCGPGSACPPT